MFNLTYFVSVGSHAHVWMYVFGLSLEYMSIFVVWADIEKEGDKWQWHSEITAQLVFWEELYLLWNMTYGLWDSPPPSLLVLFFLDLFVLFIPSLLYYIHLHFFFFIVWRKQMTNMWYPIVLQMSVLVCSSREKLKIIAESEWGTFVRIYSMIFFFFLNQCKNIICIIPTISRSLWKKCLRSCVQIP